MTAPLDRLATDDDEQVFQMLEDRNRTSHLYNAVMAEEVFARNLSAFLQARASSLR